MIELIIGVALMGMSSSIMLFMLYQMRKYLVSLYFTSPILVNLIFFFAIYKVLAYYLMPLLLGISSGFKYATEDGVKIIEIGQLYVIETLSWTTWLFGLVLVASVYKNRLLKMSYPNPASGLMVRDFSLFLLIFLSVAYLPISLVTQRSQEFFLDVVVLPIWAEIFKSLIHFAGPPASFVLFVFYFRKGSYILGIIGLIGIIGSLANLSTRGAFVYGLLFLGFLAYHLASRKKTFVVRFSFGFFLLLILYFIAGGLPSLSINPDSSQIVEFSINSEKKGNRTAIEEIEWRFGAATRMSTTFIRMYDRGQGAGLNPIRNSLAGFLPRSINPNKPHPSTLDGSDIFSQGMYMIYREIYGYDSFSMVEFSTGGHAYWELGWLGVVVLPFISGLYIGLCACYFQYFGLASSALLMSVFKPFGHVDPKIWVSDIAIQIYQIIIPLCLLFLFYIVLVRAKRILPVIRKKGIRN
jgi:hypothetical protein